MKWYLVASGMREWEEASTGYRESFRDIVFVQAKNKREAKIAALKTKEMSDWVHEARNYDMNPFSGMEADEAYCEHGKCWAENNKETCVECEMIAKKWQEEEDELNRTMWETTEQ